MRALTDFTGQRLSYEEMRAAVPQVEFDQVAIEAMDPIARGQAIELLLEWNETLKANPMLGYTPAGPKHWEFHESTALRRLISGGNRAGKTTTAIADDIIQMSPVELLPEHLHQWKRHECPFYVRLMAPDMKRTMIPVIHQKLKEWLPKELLRGGSFERAYDKTNQVLQLECGCRFDFLSYEMALDKFGGAALHRCHYDEEPPEDIRGECLLRLVDFGGDEVFSMTPLQGLSWTYRRLWKRRGEKLPNGRPRIEAWGIGIDDNRTLSEEDIEAALAEITNPAEYRQRRYGEYSERGGQVYPTYGDTRHPGWLPDELRYHEIVVGIDPGLRWAGFCWIAFDRNNYAYTFDAVQLNGEDFDNGVTPQHYVELVRAKERFWGLCRDGRRPMYVIDPAARIRSLIDGKTIQSELANRGLHTIAGDNDVEGGIANIRGRITDGSLKVAERCTILFDQAVEYSFEDRDDEKTMVKKVNDHVLDAQRYALQQRPWMPKPTKKLWLPGSADVAQAPPAPRRRRSSVLGAEA